MLTRRRFCRLTGAAAVTAWAAPVLLPRSMAAQDVNTFEVLPLRDGAWAVTGGGGNSLLLGVESGSILVDTKYFTVAQELYEVIGETVGTPTLVINTHHHGDHVGGNWFYRLNHPGVSIAAHEAGLPRTAETYAGDVLPYLDHLAADEATSAQAEELRSLIDPEHFQADLTFDDKLGIERGGLQCRLGNHGPGHTDNDAVVFVPDLNILHPGDLVFHEMHGFVDMEGGCDPVRWPKVLRKLYNSCDGETIVVPGHGNVTDRDGLASMAEYFEQLREIVEKALAEGLEPEAITELKPDVFEGLGFAEILPRALRGMTTALTKS